MRRETQNVLLILLGGALLKIALNGDYLRYVKPSQQPWMLGGGAVMVALGAIAIVRDLLAARAARDPAEGGHHHPARSAWLLMVPVLAVFLVAPPALGADSVVRTQARAPQSEPPRAAAAFPALPEGAVVPLGMAEFVARAGWDDTGSLHGRTVSLSGFVVRADGDVLLARMRIGCCAADAFPVTVRLLGDGVTGLAQDTWVEVTGQLMPGSADRRDHTPDLTVATVRPVPVPEDPYEY
ncbi:TIGR03943 family protein [Amycolatopsis arida]|uniref:TIGR03943 family protein n=1 Tax=Amycolatopsis arida TaxID=587909 RepID=A0A1I5V0C5_9PSEU|nr:TIGR03943 family protein [Amycolatopsis arida]TDX91099.1 putative repeat protein (TIGR03943 family) [Amycolatopsis arida]SFQ00963.1 TIGR03943 family protein [Amycolatopsis arida]